MLALKGQNALVTGASSGIGYEIAKYLAKAGVNLVVTARRKERLEQLKTEILEKYPVRVEILPIDLTLHEAPDKIYEQTKQLGMDISILINNAGHGYHKHFHNSAWERDLSMLNLLIVNLVRLTYLFLPGMAEKKAGYILNVSSIGAFQSTPTYALYAASKAFVFNFSIALNYELKGLDIKSTALCPGFTITEFHETSEQGTTTAFAKMGAMQASQVAKIGIDKMLKNKTYVVPGAVNKINSFFARHLPRGLMVKIAASVMGAPRD